VAFAAGTTRADTLDELEARGEQLAKAGKLSEAIDAFKLADRVSPRASHACLIALAYTRRELWPQAEIFYTLCRQRATADDPVPSWLPLAEQTLAEHLASANVAEVAISVEPARARAILAVSSFAGDEQFEPRTIHLAFGEHVITVKAPGFQIAQQMVSITDRTPRHLVIRLVSNRVTVYPRAPWYVVGAGGAILAAGAAYHLFALNPVRNRLAADVADPENVDVADYKAHSHEFDVRKDVTLALYGVGAATAIAGLVLRATVLGPRDVELGAEPRPGGGIVTVTWRRR
jgi:hypothetical protein